MNLPIDVSITMLRSPRSVSAGVVDTYRMMHEHPDPFSGKLRDYKQKKRRFDMVARYAAQDALPLAAGRWIIEQDLPITPGSCRIEVRATPSKRLVEERATFDVEVVFVYRFDCPKKASMFKLAYGGDA